jgi:N-acyl-L-homoserine lactone synthetase
VKELRSSLPLKGMTKAKKEERVRRYRKEIFNRKKEWYPVLEAGKCSLRNISV